MQKKFQDFINESSGRPNPRKKMIDRQLAMSDKEIGNVSRFQKYQSDMETDFRRVPLKKRTAMFNVYKKVYDLVMADPALSARFQKDLKGMLDADLNRKGIQEAQTYDASDKRAVAALGGDPADYKTLINAIKAQNEAVIFSSKMRPLVFKLLATAIQTLGDNPAIAKQIERKSEEKQSNNQ